MPPGEQLIPRLSVRLRAGETPEVIWASLTPDEVDQVTAEWKALSAWLDSAFTQIVDALRPAAIQIGQALSTFVDWITVQGHDVYLDTSCIGCDCVECSEIDEGPGMLLSELLSDTALAKTERVKRGGRR